MNTQKLEQRIAATEAISPPEALPHFAYRGKKLPSDRASITLTLTKSQKRKWSELGGTEWLRRTLTAAVHADRDAASKCAVKDDEGDE